MRALCRASLAKPCNGVLITMQIETPPVEKPCEKAEGERRGIED